jgi:5-methyltetrahydropteroyltriglutamate--homocysteine methyltransferase
VIWFTILIEHRDSRPFSFKNVIASIDCGLGGRVHPQIAWAKLRALRDGAAIAGKKLWS